MAGLSLECGDCKTQLRSVEEAQEHAELTGHTNFQESTEPVLNLVCTTCAKPCLSKTESDLHTKRTGHTEFTDKTAETAKPIVLERKADGPSASGSEEQSATPAGVLSSYFGQVGGGSMEGEEKATRTFLLALLGPKTAGPHDDDGWFAADFIMAHHIYSDLAHEQTWLSSVDFVSETEVGGPYLWGEKHD